MTKDEYYQFALDSYRPAESMLKMVPADKLEWNPGPTFMTMGQLICHLSGGIGSELRMLVTGNWPAPEEMEKAMKQGGMPTCNVQEARAGLEKDKAVLREVLSGVSEEDFANKIVSVPWGWKSKMELIRPKNTTNLAINPILHFFGALRPSSSRLSVDIVSNGASVSKLFNSI